MSTHLECTHLVLLHSNGDRQTTYRIASKSPERLHIS